MALFELDRNQVSRAVRHRTVNEIWLVLEGRGSMWRQQDGCEEIAPLEEGVCVSIPAGTAFQFRCDGSDGLPCAPLGARYPTQTQAAVLTRPGHLHAAQQTIQARSTP